MSGILIGTAILWILTSVLVVPLANRSVARRMAAQGLSAEAVAELPPEQKRYWQGVATRYYIL